MRSIVSWIMIAPTASIEFDVSGQPGDNYRIAASTYQPWLPTLQAKQGVQQGEVDVPNEANDPANLSQMLTVWRHVHIETDSMKAPTLDPNDPERNFIMGTVKDVVSSGPLAVTLSLIPAPGLLLQDGSPAPGRFQNGAICIGAGATPLLPSGCAGPIVVQSLDGNDTLEGLDTVSKAAGMSLPFTLLDESGGSPLNGNIVALSSLQVTIDVSVGQANYARGTFTVGGISWPVREAGGTSVVLRNRNTPLPFVVVDDDLAAHPSTVAIPPHLKDSDDPLENPLAQAYARPPWDAPSGPKIADFNRNVTDAEDLSQLTQGRDTASSPAYWAAYLQGSFQFETLQDRDPINDPFTAMGWTPDLIPPSSGSLIFSETLRDAVLSYCPDWIVVHEVGHQFGLGDDTGRHHESGLQQYILVFFGRRPGRHQKPHSAVGGLESCLIPRSSTSC